jgi:diguanylate cyclase (GGDEF)-like protein
MDVNKIKIAIVGGGERSAMLLNLLDGRDDIEIVEPRTADVVIDMTSEGKTEIVGRQSASLMCRLLEAGKNDQENAKLLEELEKHLAEMFFIHEFFKALTSYSSSVKDVANLIADGANGILGVELSCVYLADNDQKLRLTGFCGKTREEFKESIAVGEGLVGKCARDRKLINQQDPGNSELLDSFLAGNATLSMQTAVPLVIQDKLLGVLAIGQTLNRRFTEGELSRTDSIGHIASLAMQNAIFNSELERLSVTDRLTELFNHGYFQQRLDEELSNAKRRGLQVSLLMFDIDYFKKFNDTFGHPKGDKVLKRVASILKDLCRGADTVARYGGEEFVVVAPGTDKDGAAALAERIRMAVEAEPFEGNESEPQVTKTVSIGVANFPEDAIVQSELIEKADQALYKAKHSGRNRVVRA